MSADLRLGRWEDALADVEAVDTLIVDAPYSARTHEGHINHGTFDGANRGQLPYRAWDAGDVRAFCAAWSKRVRGWFVTITDDSLAPCWAAELAANGRYTFAPLPMVETGGCVRLGGDGPASWTRWIVVARPRTRRFAKWGALPGAYIGAREVKPVMGGKTLTLMRALVRDYSRPGDLVCDPCAGGATTLLAALQEGRRAVGAEMDPGHFEIAQKRLAGGFARPLFPECAGKVMTQEGFNYEK